MARSSHCIDLLDSVYVGPVPTAMAIAGFGVKSIESCMYDRATAVAGLVVSVRLPRMIEGGAESVTAAAAAGV